MKLRLLKILLALVVGLIVFVAFISQQKSAKKTPTYSDVRNLYAPPATNLPPVPLPTGSKPVSQLTTGEKSSVEKCFDSRMKPAIEKWAAAYAGHLPISATNITFDKLHSIDSGPYGGFFTFMLGDTTFTVLSNIHGTKVFYLMTKQAARDLNSVPRDGTPHDLSVPIKREEVLRMATADTGLQYELKDVVIHPTAAYSTIDGGANVEVGIKYEHGMALIRPDDLSFVMDSNAMIITYQH